MLSLHSYQAEVCRSGPTCGLQIMTMLNILLKPFNFLLVWTYCQGKLNMTHGFLQTSKF